MYLTVDLTDAPNLICFLLGCASGAIMACFAGVVCLGRELHVIRNMLRGLSVTTRVNHR